MPYGDRAHPSVTDHPAARTSGYGDRARSTPSSGKPHHRGFFTRFGSDIKDMAVNFPGGVVAAGSAVGHDIGAFTHNLYHGVGLPGGPRGEKAHGGRTSKIVAAMGKQYKEDFQHPGRHPGNFTVDVTGLVSAGAGTAARVAEAGRVIRAGEGAGAAGRALLERAPSKIRYAKLPGHQPLVHGSYSRNAALRVAQQLTDRAREAFPERRILSPKSAKTRYGDAFARTQRRLNDLEKSKGTALQRAGRHLTDAEQKAIQVVAEGVPIDKRIQFHSNQLENLKGANATRTRQEIALLHATKQYVVNTRGGPTIRSQFKDLKDVYNQARDIAKTRERTLVKAGALSDTTSRVHAPGRIITGDEEFAGGKFRVPYGKKRGITANLRIGANDSIGIPKKPSTLNHPFEAKILSTGGGRTDITNLMAETHLEAQRYSAALRARSFIMKNAQDTVDGASEGRLAIPRKYAVAVRQDAWRNKTLSPKVAEILKAAEEGHKLTSDEIHIMGQHYEAFRKELFDQNVLPTNEKIPGVKWIDRRTLGGLDEPNPLVGWNDKARKGLGAFDAVNNAERAAILYLKPAYAVPNVLGNTALTLLQQGFAAPKHLSASFRLSHKIGAADAAKIDELVGNGITSVLKSGQGKGARATQWLGGKWESVVDQPFRRASFLYEASKQGFKTDKEIKSLLNNMKNRDKLHQITDLANKELIDYGNLGPYEREIIRRVLFFYPWIKGSTVFAARQLGEHPIASSVQAQLGRQGAETQHEWLKHGPAWAEALVKTGGTGNIVRTINPAAASITQTPADLLQALSGEGGHQLAENFTPAIQALQTAFTGLDPLGRKVKGNKWEAGAKQLYQGLPAFALYNRLTHDQSKKTFPMTKEQAFLLFLLGITDKNTNVGKLEHAGYAERHPH